MKRVEPEVYLIAQPQVDYDKLGEYLESIGAEDFQGLAGNSDAEQLCEIMGRLCYNSFVPGANPNVTKIRTEGYLQNIIKQGHGSVLEHAQVSFIFQNVSRVLTHELVRHRTGVAISQESLRFVRLTDLSAYIPVDIEVNGEALRLFVETINKLEEVQAVLADLYNIDSLSFSEKKALTSAFRRLAPIGLATTIGWSANLRTVRHVIEQRTTIHAEEEIRLLFRKVYGIMKTEFPSVFEDYTVTDDGTVTTENKKV